MPARQAVYTLGYHPTPTPKSFPVSFPVKVGGGPREDASLEKQAIPCREHFCFYLSRVPEPGVSTLILQPRAPLVSPFLMTETAKKIVLTNSARVD